MSKASIIGAGAAGCLAAVELKRRCPDTEVVVLEAGPRPLAKVALTGGGRCNLTNTFAGVGDLREAYPRGFRLMKRALKEFGPRETMRWFEAEGVALTEEDGGRIFPASGDAMQVVRALLRAMDRAGVKTVCNGRVTDIRSVLETSDAVIVTTGGSPKRTGLGFLDPLGLEIEEPVPSLFTFTVPDPALRSLMGLVVQAGVSLPGTAFKADGPLLVTDWGLSGPAALKLSSYAARYLADKSYRADIAINWLSSGESTVREQLQKTADEMKSGAESLNKSVISLNSGIGTVNKGASDTKTASGSLHSGMSTLQADLQSLTGRNAALSGEADQLMTVTLASGRVVLDMALRNLNVDVPELTYENYTRVLSDLEALLNKELLEAYTVSQKRESLKVSYEEEIKEIRKNTEEAVRMRILNEVLALEGMSFGADQYEKRIKAGQITRRTQQRIRSTVAQRMADEEIVAAIEEQVDAQVEQIVDELMASDDTTEKIRTELETTDLEEIRDLIRAVRSQLDQTAALKTDMETYFGTVNAAAEKAKTLKTASSALRTAAGKLSEQAAALATAASAPGSAAVALQSSGAALSKSAQALARQAKTEQTSLGEMAKAAESLDTSVTALKTDASALHTAVGTLLSATEALKTLKTSLDADVKTIADASASLTTQAGTLASLLTSQKDAAAEAAEMVSAMPVDPASIEPVAETLIPERSQDESTTAASGSPAGEEAKKAASVLLGHAQSDLMQLLNLYTGIRDTLGGGSDYDPVPEGMTGDTVYIYRMMIQ